MSGGTLRVWRALLQRELTDAAGGLGMLTVVQAAVCLVALYALYAEGGSLLGTLSIVHYVGLYLFAHAYAGRLLVPELRDRLLTFYDALPVTRLQVFAVKWVVGYGVVALVHLVLLGAVFWGLADGVLSTAAVGRLVGVELLAAGFLWSFAWALEFVGRYRWPLVLILVFTQLTLHEGFGVDLGSRAPLAVVQNAELAAVGLDDLHIASTMLWVVALAWLPSVMLVGGRERVMDLSRRMSAPERARVGAAVIASFTVFAVAIAEQTDGVYRLTPATTYDGPVEVLVAERLVADHPELGPTLSRSLADAHEALGLDEVDPVSVSRRSGLRGVRVQSGETGNREGYLFQVDDRKPGFAVEEVVAAALLGILNDKTELRTHVNPMHWFWDGFTTSWASRQLGPHPSPSRLACAAWGATHHPDLPVGRWLAVHERVHDDVANAMASSLYDTARAEVGDAALLAFARSYTATPTPRGLRGTLLELTDPPWERFRRLTGMSVPSLLDAWRARMVALPPGLAQIVASEPMPSAEVSWHARGTTSALEVRVAAGPEPEYPQVVRFGVSDLLHTGATQDARTLVGLDDAAEPVVTDAAWPSGTYVSWRVERWSPALGCMLASPWVREVAP